MNFELYAIWIQKDIFSTGSANSILDKVCRTAISLDLGLRANVPCGLTEHSPETPAIHSPPSIAFNNFIYNQKSASNLWMMFLYASRDATNILWHNKGTGH
jgi:hypothetical protein